MSAIELQTAFFKHLKEKLPNHLSMVDEVATLLNISYDSAYRRIRGEKTLGFDEIQILADHYKVSIDQFLGLTTDAFLFSGSLINRERFEMSEHLNKMANMLAYIASANKKQIYYFSKDLPFFYNLALPELAAFKCYFWSRYNLNYTDFYKSHFLISDYIDLFNEPSKKILGLYMQIPSAEVWNVDSINVTIREIDYYRESKIFSSVQDIITVYECLEKLVDHIEQQVEYGAKFPFGKPDLSRKIKYAVFINEIGFGDNSVLVQVNNERMVFLNHNIINYVMVTDERFVEYSWQTMNTVLKKSTLISEAGDKDRELFFDTLRQRIHDKKKLV
jgi:hypothetical protein